MRDASKHKEPESWEDCARFLYDVLDDIDTVDDIAKEDDAWYRKRVRALQNLRHRVAVVDAAGHNVYFAVLDEKPEKRCGGGAYLVTLLLAVGISSAIWLSVGAYVGF